MDLGPWVPTVVASGQAPLLGAVLVGLLASLGPCPLATNLSALGYMTKVPPCSACCSRSPFAPTALFGIGTSDR